MVSFCSKAHVWRQGARRGREAHPITPVIEFLAPPLPLARAAQVCGAHATLIKESLRGCPVVLLRLARASALLLPERGIYLLRECLERGEMSPGTRAHGMREEDTEGGETEAALAVLGGLAPVEDAYAALGVLGEVAVWVCFLWATSCQR